MIPILFDKTFERIPFEEAGFEFLLNFVREICLRSKIRASNFCTLINIQHKFKNKNIPTFLYLRKTGSGECTK